MITEQMINAIKIELYQKGKNLDVKFNEKKPRVANTQK